jgi:CRP-like cAMP-binding protein
MPADGFVPGNRLLAALPADILELLTPELETVPLRNRDVVQRIGRQAEHVYFPHSGIGSIVIHMQGGVNVEAATVGNEGMLGLQYVLGDTLATEETMIQLPGEASRLRIRVLRAEFDRDDRLRTLLLQYAQLLMGQIAQGAACNRLHPIDARCARWLLSTHDRVEGDTFPLTQDFLALMLGVRRAGVSVTQQALQQDGLIGYSRGWSQFTIAPLWRLFPASATASSVTGSPGFLLGRHPSRVWPTELNKPIVVPVAFARGEHQSCVIEHGDLATLIADQPGALKLHGDFGDAGASSAEHDSEKLMGKRHGIRLQAVMHH